MIHSLSQKTDRKPVLVVVMDGVGIGRGDAGDAVAQAHTPNLDRYRRGPLSTQLQAHGRAVGLPSDSDIGNSEVGHNAMGAGRILAQGARLVAEGMASGSIFLSPTWQELIASTQKHHRTLHFIGLLSDGNVHSHIDHLLAMLARARSEGVPTVRIHALLDGRDVPRKSAERYLAQLQAALDTHNHGGHCDYRIASGGGRMQLTMDRYGADWPMVARGWQHHVRGQGRFFADPHQALQTLRAENPDAGDQDLPGFVIAEDGAAIGPIQDGDSVVAFNFRGDRMLQWAQAFESETMPHFDRGKRPNVCFAGMTLWDGDAHTPSKYLVTMPPIEGTLGERVAAAGLRQLACSETQKFGHVTYFWNGNRSDSFSPKLEQYIEIPSLPAPFDATPQMRAAEIAERVAQEAHKGSFDLGRINLANGDMVGHTGNFSATVAAIEATDAALGVLERAIVGDGGTLIVTADHGNADDMLERDARTGELVVDRCGGYIPKTSHSTNPVPFCVVSQNHQAAHWQINPRVQNPTLGHIAATCAFLVGLPAQEDFLPSLLSSSPNLT